MISGKWHDIALTAPTPIEMMAAAKTTTRIENTVVLAFTLTTWPKCAIEHCRPRSGYLATLGALDSFFEGLSVARKGERRDDSQYGNHEEP